MTFFWGRCNYGYIVSNNYLPSYLCTTRQLHVQLHAGKFKITQFGDIQFTKIINLKGDLNLQPELFYKKSSFKSKEYGK